MLRLPPGSTRTDTLVPSRTGFRCRLRRGGARRGFRQLVAVHAVEPYPRRILAVRLLVGQRPGDAAGVPFLAAGRAGVAADTGVQVDHQPELDLRRRRQRGHGTVRWRSLPEPYPTSSSENTKPTAPRQRGDGGRTLPPPPPPGNAHR